MATVDVEFPSGNTTASFFGHTSATQADCESHVAALAEGKAVPATVQGPHSYTVFAGPDLESVVQFRPKSSPLPTESTVLARKIYGDLAPSVSFEGTIGDETSGSDKEPLLVYKMNRIPGATYQEFIGASDTLDNSVEASSYRKTLMVDLANLFALAWDSPQTVSDDELAQLREGYIRKLAALHTILPERFHAVVQECIDNVDHVLSLPLVFAHQDLSLADIIVDKSSHLTGIVSWAQAHVSPFGSNLHALQLIAGKMHPQNGYFKYDDYLELSGAFWSTLQEKVGTLSKETLHTIKLAMHTSLLISRSFTSDNVPIGDDAEGRYNLLFLDAFVLA